MAGDIFGELLINGVDRNNPAKAGEDLDCAVQEREVVRMDCSRLYRTLESSKRSSRRTPPNKNPPIWKECAEPFLTTVFLWTPIMTFDSGCRNIVGSTAIGWKLFQEI